MNKKERILVPVELEVFTPDYQAKGTPDEMLENYEHLQEMLQHLPAKNNKLGKKKLKYYTQSIYPWIF